MNKKGLTLVELIAVIAIIGILALLVTPGIIALRNNVLNRTLQTRESQIENAAKDYAMENLQLLKSVVNREITDIDNFKDQYDDDFNVLNEDCSWITVNGLINNGYLNGSTSYVNTEGGEKEEQMINPVTGESMNDYMVCMRYDTNDAISRTIVTIIYKGD